jgi:hypothetical protein
MKTATTFHSDFFNTDCLLVDGEPHFSVTGAAKTLYGKTAGPAKIFPAIGNLVSVQTPSSTSDLHDLPGFSSVLVERETGPIIAHAMDEETFTQLLWQYSEKKTKAGEYARTQLKAITGVAINLILKKEAGLVTEEAAKEIDASIAKFFKSEPGKEKAGSIQGLKELLIANGQKDRCARMGVLVNEFIYNRLPKPVYEELLARTGARRGHLDHTKWQHLDESTQKRIDDIISVASMLIRREMREGQILNFAPVIKDLDEVMPRHRSSGYVSL